MRKASPTSQGRRTNSPPLIAGRSPGSRPALAIQLRRHDSLIPRSLGISRTGFSRSRANSIARRRNSGG